MNIVLDASAAVELLLRRKRSEDIGEFVAEAKWVLVPNLYVVELTNVFWKYQRYHDLSTESCEDAIEKGLALPDTFTDDRELWREAFDMACRCKATVYDMLYLVLARRQSAYLLSMDRKLMALAAQHDVRTR